MISEHLLCLHLVGLACLFLCLDFSGKNKGVGDKGCLYDLGDEEQGHASFYLEADCY